MYEARGAPDTHHESHTCEIHFGYEERELVAIVEYYAVSYNCKWHHNEFVEVQRVLDEDMEEIEEFDDAESFRKIEQIFNDTLGSMSDLDIQPY